MVALTLLMAPALPAGKEKGTTRKKLSVKLLQNSVQRLADASTDLAIRRRRPGRERGEENRTGLKAQAHHGPGPAGSGLHAGTVLRFHHFNSPVRDSQFNVEYSTRADLRKPVGYHYASWTDSWEPTTWVEMCTRRFRVASGEIHNIRTAYPIKCPLRARAK